MKKRNRKAIEGEEESLAVDRRELQRHVAQNSIGQFARPATISSTPTGIVGNASRRDTGNTESWPGPFATARQMIAQRQEALQARLQQQQRHEQGEEEQFEDEDVYDQILQSLQWSPRPNATPGKRQPVVSLEEQCMQKLVLHFDSVQSLGCLPEEICSRLITALAIHRKLTSDALLLCLPDAIDALPTALALPECSSVSEDALHTVLLRYQEASLVSLDLGNCGASFTDKTAEVLAGVGGRLEVLRLTGTFKLTDAALRTLLQRLPLLRVIDLSSCLRIQGATLRTALPDTLSQLSALTLDHISHLDDADLASLQAMERLERLSVRGLAKLTDAGLTGLLDKRGAGLRSLIVADCHLLTDALLEGIRSHCRVLQELNIARIAATASGLLALFLAKDSFCSVGTLERLVLQGLDALTDEAVIAYCIHYGSSSLALDVSSCRALTGKSIVALARHCRRVAELNVSFCRSIKQDALGAFVESCPCLETLHVWGCTQLTAAFYDACTADNERLQIQGFFAGAATGNR